MWFVVERTWPEKFLSYFHFMSVFDCTLLRLLWLFFIDDYKSGSFINSWHRPLLTGPGFSKVDFDFVLSLFDEDVLLNYFSSKKARSCNIDVGPDIGNCWVHDVCSTLRENRKAKQSSRTFSLIFILWRNGDVFILKEEQRSSLPPFFQRTVFTNALQLEPKLHGTGNDLAVAF